MASESKYGLSDFIAEPITHLDKLNQHPQSRRYAFEVFVCKVQSEVVDELKRLEAQAQQNRELLDPLYQNTGAGDLDLQPALEGRIDRWIREEGGGGISFVMQNGLVFEKAGVNVSIVHGVLPDSAAAQMRSRGKPLNQTGNLRFFAAGVSSVIHPRNPNVPTIHFNYRYFEIEGIVGESQDLWWFGGGTDLTPYILNHQDARHFHLELKQACDPHHADYYRKYKSWCDKYFRIPHRGECRGVGGLFFDDVDTPDWEQAFAFVRSCAAAIIPCYIPLVERNMYKTFTKEDRDFQLIRRGR